MQVPRYLLAYDPPKLKVVNADLLIVGSGIAGLYTALKAGERKVIVITKEKTEDSSTEYAQGGIAAVLSDEDSPQLHIEDTLKAGAGLCVIDVVKTLVSEGSDRVRELIAMGTEFDRLENTLNLTREGAHSRSRILHAHGDATGEEIRRALVRNVLHLDWIEIYEDTYALDIVQARDGRCLGVLAYDRPQKVFTFFTAPATVIATGGAGHVYAHTSNPDVATGDGIAMGYRSGNVLMDMEFIQFHPTTLYCSDSSTFLISEAVRGEGGILRNKAGYRFMPDYHPLGELAPRDIVARAIFTEMKKDDLPHVWLDVTHLDGDFIKKRFPRIYCRCLQEGHDITETMVPVHPAAHYIMGGIRTDINGQTNMPGLFASGEAAATGVHGANRLASNSLLEGLVFGRRIALKIGAEEMQAPNWDQIYKEPFPALPRGDDEELIKVRKKLQRLMSKNVGIVRTPEELKAALVAVSDFEPFLHKSYLQPASWETQNLIIVAFNTIQAALKRQESRGCHFRTDFPKALPGWEKRHIILRRAKKEGEIIELP